MEIATLTRVGEGEAGRTEIRVLPAEEVESLIRDHVTREEARKKEEKAKVEKAKTKEEKAKAEKAAASKTS